MRRECRNKRFVPTSISAAVVWRRRWLYPKSGRYCLCAVRPSRIANSNQSSGIAGKRSVVAGDVVERRFKSVSDTGISLTVLCFVGLSDLPMIGDLGIPCL